MSFFWCAFLYTDIIIIYTTLSYMINIYVYLNEDPMHTLYIYIHTCMRMHVSYRPWSEPSTVGPGVF